MDEELMDITTEQSIDVGISETTDVNVVIEDEEYDVSAEEVVANIEAETSKTIEIAVEESIGWVGGDSEKHYSLLGRDEPNQHPITAITGLREELNDIEALDVVYSDKRNQANYYLWEDENILQEDRVGYFVSIGSSIDKIVLCDSDNDVFGVTVDSAGFIGAQDDIARDIKYGLVVTNGIVHVRCELSVGIGDYVVSNDYGYATSNKNGYKVVGRHKIDGVEYAEITLVTPIERICKISDNVDNLSDRMDDAETNIVATMNVANAAYNKAGEIRDVSEEAIRNALEALEKADGVVEDVGKIEETVASANQVAVQAKAIAESAVVSADAIRNEAVEIANDTLSSVNDLTKKLEPITTWSDPETGNTGAEYFTTYVKDGVATKAEVQTVETLTNDNKSAIEKNAESFRSLVSLVDKYSVGEYSQAYGLTYEQAKSILKAGMIYIPSNNPQGATHSETYEGQGHDNDFTEGRCYEWDGSDWQEHTVGQVWISNVIPANSSGIYEYWYIDSNEPPDGYEPYALYIWDEVRDESGNTNMQWVKVNTLAGNVNNRITSMIRQDVNSITAEVVNAYGAVAGFGAKLSDTDAKVNSIASWPTDDGTHNMAILESKVDGDESYMVLAAVTDVDGESKITELGGAKIILNDSTLGSYIQFDADNINFTAEDYQVIANKINLTGYVTIDSLKGDGTTEIDGSRITTGSIQSSNYVENESGTKLNLEDGTFDSKYFKIDSTGNMIAAGGTIGGWNISPGGLYKLADVGCYNGMGLYPNGDNGYVFYAGGYGKTASNTSAASAPFRITTGGAMYASAGTIGGWSIDSDGIYYSSDNNTNHRTVGMSPGYNYNSNMWCFWAGATNITASGYAKVDDAPFRVDRSGNMYATNADITGTIRASQGNFGHFQIGGNAAWHNMVSADGLFGTTARSDICFDAECIALNYKVDGDMWSALWVEIIRNTITSDRTLKRNISAINEHNELDMFYDLIQPSLFNYSEEALRGDSSRKHYGVIAQDILQAEADCGISNSSIVFGGNGSPLSVAYQEFIALNIWQIQKAKARIADLENEVATLKEKLETLIDE